MMLFLHSINNPYDAVDLHTRCIIILLFQNALLQHVFYRLVFGQQVHSVYRISHHHGAGDGPKISIHLYLKLQVLAMSAIANHLEVVIDASALNHGYPIQNYAIVTVKSSHNTN